MAQAPLPPAPLLMAVGEPANACGPRGSEGLGGVGEGERDTQVTQGVSLRGGLVTGLDPMPI